MCLRRGGLSYCLCCKYDHFFGISLLRIEDDVFYAHSLSDNPDTSQWQTLPDHLEATAALAERFAAEFGAQNAGRLAIGSKKIFKRQFIEIRVCTLSCCLYEGKTDRGIQKR